MKMRGNINCFAWSNPNIVLNHVHMFLSIDLSIYLFNIVCLCTQPTCWVQVVLKEKGTLQLKFKRGGPGY